MVATQPSLPTIYFSTSGFVLYAIVQQCSVIRVLVAHMAASDVPESSTSSRSADLQLMSDQSSGSEFPATQQQKRKRQLQTAFRSSLKGMIASMKEFFEREKTTGAPILFGNVIKRTAEALQVSPASVKRVGSEMRSQGFVSSPAKLGRK